MSWKLPDWDGTRTQGGLLPEWARQLSESCTTHTFTTQWVRSGRAVVARRVSGTGPRLVITRSEDEMLIALGLKSFHPPS